MFSPLPALPENILLNSKKLQRIILIILCRHYFLKPRIVPTPPRTDAGSGASPPTGQFRFRTASRVSADIRIFSKLISFRDAAKILCL